MEDITMAMTNRNNAKLDCMIYYTLDELVPQDHLVRKMEEALDFRFIYPKALAKENIHISRRTVTKYREQLLIPCASKRYTK